jgi:hypothetical protein
MGHTGNLPFLSNRKTYEVTLLSNGKLFMYVEILPWRIDFTITLKWG